MKVKSKNEVPQSCPTPCDPMDCRLPGSSVHGIFQARVLEWDAIAFSAQVRMAIIKKIYRQQMLERVWRKDISLALLTGVQTDIITMENTMEIP